MNPTKIAENIRNEYTERKETKLDTLMELDRKAKQPAEVFSYAFGSVGSLVLGTGMCLAMKVIPALAGITALMPLGIGVGLIGIAMVGANYFIYKAMLKRGKEKYGKEILALTSEILGE